MEKKTSFEKGLTASTILGFARPEVTIDNAAIMNCTTGRKKKSFAFFKLDVGETKPVKWNASAEDILSLEGAPVTYADGIPTLNWDGYALTIPSDLSEAVRFHKLN